MNKRKKIKSLKHYVNDKEELINQVFSSIPEKQIKKMIPVTLKDMSIDELKAECLVELLTMSTNKISRILEGRKCTEESVCTDNKKFSKKRTNNKNTANHTANKKKKYDKNLEADEISDADQQVNCSFSKDIRFGSRKKHKEKKYKVNKKNKNSGDEKEVIDCYNKEKNLLELLELEMRAKAIRSLLKQEEEELDKQSEKSKIETEFKQKEKTKGDLRTNFIEPRAKCLNEIIADKETKKYSEKSVQQIQLDIQTPSELEILSSSQKAVDNKEAVKEKYDWNEEERLLYEDDDVSDEKSENDLHKENEKSEEQCTTSWAERWLQSKDVKRVVATSKMLAAVRNKMKINLKSTNNAKQTVSNHKFRIPQIIGTVKEYDTLEQLEATISGDTN